VWRYLVATGVALLVVVAGRGASSWAGDQVTAVGAVSGTVFDGRLRTPLPFATVTLASIRSGTTVVSDELGRFVFAGVPEGEYQLVARKPGYVDGTSGPIAGHVGLAPAIVAVRAGSWVKARDVFLWPPGAVSGIVRDDRGRAVVDVWVRALAVREIGHTRVLAAGPTSRTDDRGAFRLTGLSSGDYFVVALPKDIDAPPLQGRRRVYPSTYYPGTREAQAAQVVRVGRVAERRDIDIVLSAELAFTVSGTVVASMPRSANVKVRLVHANDETIGLGGTAVESAVSADGRFVFADVPEGDYRVEAGTEWPDVSLPSTIAGSQPAALLPRTLGGGARNGVVLRSPLNGVDTYFPRASAAVWGTTTIHVQGGDQIVTVPLGAGGSMSGHVRLSGDARAQLADVVPGGRLYVSVDPAGGAALVDLQTGAFVVVDDIPPGHYWLDLPNVSGAALRSISRLGTSLVSSGIQVGAGQNLADIEIAIETPGAEISGIVRDRTGRGVGGAVVLLLTGQHGDGTPPSVIAAESADQGGRYRFSSIGRRLLSGGDYKLFALASAEAIDSQDPDLLVEWSRAARAIEVQSGGKAIADLMVIEAPGGSR
jgi:hypothetical protein